MVVIIVLGFLAVMVMIVVTVPFLFLFDDDCQQHMRAVIF